MASSESVKAALSNSLPPIKTVFGDKNLEKGSFIAKAEAQDVPQLSCAGLDTTQKYIHVNIDLDAPFPSFPFLGPILHFLQTDLVASPSGDLGSSAAPAVAWIPPNPPPPSGNHRYVSLLYAQPDGFNANGELVPKEGLSKMGRMRFDFEGFEKKAGLGKPVAAGWWESR